MPLCVHPFFDADTCSYSYLIADPDRAVAGIIDPVLNYDAESGEVMTQTADDLAALAEALRYRVTWILETHVHADHLSAAGYLKSRFPDARIGIGRRVETVRDSYLESHARCGDVLEFDALFADGDEVVIGGCRGKVLATPGHTPACVTYLFDDVAFVGDTLFMPDFGTGRCDFPGGCARQLYRSIQRLLALPDQTRLFVGHDYAPGGRVYRFVTTVSAERCNNKHVHDGVTEDQFVALRTGRDAQLAAPRLIEKALATNLFLTDERRTVASLH